MRRCSLLALLLVATTWASAQTLDTLAWLEGVQDRMSAIDMLRNRKPKAIWAQVPDKPALVAVDVDADEPPLQGMHLLIYMDGTGVAAISSIRYVGADSTLDTSTHYFDADGSTLAVRWELTTKPKDCAGVQDLVTSREEYYVDGKMLERFDWTTDPDGNDLSERSCKVLQPKGRMPVFRDRGKMQTTLRIPAAL